MRRAREQVGFIEVGEVNLKGFAKPVEVFEAPTAERQDGAIGRGEEAVGGTPARQTAAVAQRGACLVAEGVRRENDWTAHPGLTAPGCVVHDA